MSVGGSHMVVKEEKSSSFRFFHLGKVRTHAAYNGRKFVYTGILTMAREFDKLSVDAIVFFSQCITHGRD